MGHVLRLRWCRSEQPPTTGHEARVVGGRSTRTHWVPGPAGPAGPKMRAAEVLDIVAYQFSQIRKRLDKQIHRTGELQTQTGELRRRPVNQMQLDQIHQLLKD